MMPARTMKNAIEVSSDGFFLLTLLLFLIKTRARITTANMAINMYVCCMYGALIYFFALPERYSLATKRIPRIITRVEIIKDCPREVIRKAAPKMIKMMPPSFSFRHAIYVAAMRI